MIMLTISVCWFLRKVVQHSATQMLLGMHALVCFRNQFRAQISSQNPNFAATDDYSTSVPLRTTARPAREAPSRLALGAYGATPFKIGELERFVRALSAYVLMSDREPGLDTFIERKGGRQYVTHLPLSSQIAKFRQTTPDRSIEPSYSGTSRTYSSASC